MAETKTPLPAMTLSPSAVPTSPVSAPTDLKALATGINECIALISRAMQHCVERAFEAGDLLNKAKASVPHGNFAQWLEENCKLSERTAVRYMRLAANRKTIEDELKKKSATM